MHRKCFYSFHYQADNWRVAKIRNIGVILGNRAASDNDWEKIRSGGDQNIKRWIDNQLDGRSCTIVLAGTNTANRKWINYEIIRSWNRGMGVLVIYIHNIVDSYGNQCSKGANPLFYITYGAENRRLSAIAKAYDPPKITSRGVYHYIEDNIQLWIEEAIRIRKLYP